MISRCTETPGGRSLIGDMAGPDTIRIDLRAALPVAVFGLVVLVIIFVQLCGTQDVTLPAGQTPLALGTRAPTFTPGPGATAAPGRTVVPTATSAPQPGGAQRDLVRAQDLVTLRQALEKYRTQHSNKYPDTGGGIQTLCVYQQDDKGCALQAVLNPLPADPLGDPAKNGYWYKSDGATYTLYAQREATAVPECAEHPEHLKDFSSLMCVLSP